MKLRAPNFLVLLRHIGSGQIYTAAIHEKTRTNRLFPFTLDVLYITLRRMKVHGLLRIVRDGTRVPGGRPQHLWVATSKGRKLLQTWQDFLKEEPE